MQLYIGHGNYKKWDINNKELAWKNPREISNQLKFNSSYDEIKGSIFFRYKSLLKDEGERRANNEFIDILKNEHYSNPAKLPRKILSNKVEIEAAKIKKNN